MELHHHVFKIWLLSLVKSTGSISLAARQAKISVSAVSQSLTQLEAHLGTVLLERTKNGTRISEAGERLIQALTPALNAFSSFDPESLTPMKPQTKIRLGAYESLAVDLVPRLMRVLRSKLPQVNATICIERSRKLIEMISDGEIDVAFITDPPSDSRLNIKKFASDTYGLFIHKSVASSRNCEQLIETYGISILNSDDYLHTKSFTRYFKSLNLGVSPTVETWSFELILALALEGTTVGALPLRVANRYKDELVRIDSPAESPASDPGSHQLAVACRPDFSMQIFTSILNEIAEES
jgi:molybdate transport repressor ModE-like protein